MNQIMVGRHGLVTGDCLTQLANMADGSVDAAITSPPYNIGAAYGVYDDRKPQPAYLAWLAEIGRHLRRVLRDDGALFLNVGGTSRSPWLAMDVAQVFRPMFCLQNHIVWAKAVSIGDSSFGHFKPVNSPRFLNHAHEDILHLTKSGSVAIDRLAVGVPFMDKSNIARRGHAQDKRCAGNVWHVPYETVQKRAEKFDHPAGFPVELPRRCLRLHGKADAVVLDPFMGTGTTLVAAEQLGHRGIGIDLDPDYVATAERRLRAAMAP